MLKSFCLLYLKQDGNHDDNDYDFESLTKVFCNVYKFGGSLSKMC